MVSPARHSLAVLFAALLAICLCSAAPGLAHADAGSSAANGDSSAVPAQADDLIPYSLGGAQISLPANGLEIVTLGGIALISNEDASLMVTIVPATDETGLPTTEEDLFDYFGLLAQTAAEQLGVTAPSGYPFTMSDGAGAYLYLIAYEADGEAVRASMCFVPVSPTDYTLVQITFDSTNSEAAELADLISATVALATPEAIPLDSIDSAIELTQKTEAGGLTFGLPEDFALDKDSADDKPSWYSGDGTVMLSVMPGLVTGISALGVETFDLIAEGIAESLEGRIEGNTLISNEGAKVYAYVFTFSSGDIEFVGALGMVPLADDTVTSVLALAPIQKAETLDATVTAVFDSIRLA